MPEIYPFLNFPIIQKGDNLAQLILESYHQNSLEVNGKDILVIAQTIISRAEGAIVSLDNVNPSPFAFEIAKQSNRSPQLVEIILQEAKNLCKFRNGVLVTETKHGFVCANSGVDKSNVPEPNTVSLLPKNPSLSAKQIREYIEKKVDKKIAVIISDTHNRPFRLGAINIAIGCSGIEPLKSYKNKKDLFNYRLKSSVISQVDQLCSAAGLAMGEADEGIPVVLIRDYNFKRKEKVAVEEFIRPEQKDYFR